MRSKEKAILPGVFIGIFLCIASVNAEEMDSCASVDACIQRIHEIAETLPPKRTDVSQDGWAVARRISLFGDEAVSRLVPLLKDPNDSVAQIASVALRQTSVIDKKYLPQIIEALDGDRDLGWLPPALGRIDSPQAAEEAVKRLLVSVSAPHNQEAYAVILSGRRAIHFIINEAKCRTGCGRDDVQNLGYVLGEMDVEPREEAAKLLGAAITSSATPNEAKAGMIYMISSLRESALIVEPDLIALREKQPDLQPAIDRALVRMNSKQAGTILANQLRIKPDFYVLIDLANSGPAGMDAGPVVTDLLNHSNLEIRLAAARALGYIKYQESVPNLIALLDEPLDVRLNWVAAESIGRIADASGFTALTETSRSHWHPAVRKSASKAIANIHSNAECQPRCQKTRIASDFFKYAHFKTRACKRITLKKVNEPAKTKLYKPQDEAKLKALTYPTEVIGYGASDEAEQLAADPDAIIIVRSYNIEEKRHPIDQVPDVALRTMHGWLAGSGRGEWGGEVVYIEDGEEPVKILTDNIEDIYKLGNRYIVVAGLAHLTMNSGVIYEVIPTSNGSWDSQLWRTLPGAPRSTWLVETGELLVNTIGGGSILISRDGSMRMAKCLNN